MSEMIERIAAAIMDCDAAGGVSWSAAKVVAKAALEAMREPTGPMMWAVGEDLGSPLYFVWRDMIDAALIDSRDADNRRHEG